MQGDGAVVDDHGLGSGGLFSGFGSRRDCQDERQRWGGSYLPQRRAQGASPEDFFTSSAMSSDSGSPSR